MMFKTGVILLVIFVVLFVTGAAFRIEHWWYNRALAFTLGLGLGLVGLPGLTAAICAGWEMLP